MHQELLKNDCPHVVVGTPGRILDLANKKFLKLGHLKHFVLDECDKLLDGLDMRRDIQTIFSHTPHDKQVMMFSATLSKEIRPVRSCLFVCFCCFCCFFLINMSLFSAVVPAACIHSQYIYCTRSRVFDFILTFD